MVWQGISNYKEIVSIINATVHEQNGLTKLLTYLNLSWIDISKQDIAQVYWGIVTGTFYSLSLKYAGQCLESLKVIIIHYLDLLLRSTSSQHLKECLGNYFYEYILIILCISLSILFSGSCDLKIFKYLKFIRKKLLLESN